MPLTQISLREGKSPDFRRQLMEEVYLACIIHEDSAARGNLAKQVS